MMEERPLPWLRMPRAGVIVVVFTAFAVGMAWLFAGNDSLLSLSMFAGVAVASWVYYRKRCPKCGGKIVVQKDYREGKRQHRWLYECQRCQILWEGDWVDDDG
jgi:hypothetical protein